MYTVNNENDNDRQRTNVDWNVSRLCQIVKMCPIDSVILFLEEQEDKYVYTKQ